MDRRIFHRLIELDDVINVVSKYYKLAPLGVEEIDLLNGLGRVLAEDIYAPIDHPPFDRSEVDGYAVRAEDTYGADEHRPVELEVIGGVEAGVKPGIAVSRGQAAEIATGAMLPRGANGVVMVEYTGRRGNRILVYRSIVPGENVATTGSDISMGDLVLTRGTRITANEIGLLAGLGITRVKVYRRPRIAVFSTGNEVVEPGEPLKDGKVYDVNGYLIASSLTELGAEVEFLGKLPDNYDTIYREVSSALDRYDIIITSGSTSAGLGDLVYRVFDNLGEPGVIVHGLLIKPGKPTVIAVARGKLLFGLPGFPLSCYMVLNKVVKPVVTRLLGLREEPRRIIKAKLPVRIRKPFGRTWLLPVALVEGPSGFTAYPVSMKSGSISPLIRSDGFAVLESNRDVYYEDEVIEVELYSPTIRVPELVIIGSNDPLLYVILDKIGLIDYTRVIVTGSMGGWFAVKRGEADIAPTHLLDEETGVYNTPFLDKLGLRDEAVLIRGYDRRIGIVVKQGNPKNVMSVKDFLRSDITIVNRPRGAGARILLDILLKKIATEKGIGFEELVRNINGYTYEVKTHTAIAAAVKQGRADAGIAVEYVAKAYGLDFIPITWEHYDFLIRKDRLDKKRVKEFMEALRSKTIRELVNSTTGYRAPDNMGYTIS